MKLRINRLLLFSIFLLFCSFTTVKWYVCNSEAGKFKIEFPAKPQQNEKIVNTPSGPMQMHLLMFDGDQADEGNKLYMLMYSDYPESVISSGKSKSLVDTFFKNAIEGAIHNIQGTLLSVENTNVKNYPGRIVKTSFSTGKGIMEMRMYLVKNRMYILEVGYQKGQLNTTSQQHFFNSFTLTNGKL